MSLHIVVLVKQVPDTKNIKGNAMKEDGTVNRAALPAIFNPEDLHALEAALVVKDEHPDTRVSVLTMGPQAATEVLKESLYRGADHVALISDRRFAGADTLATSYAIARAIEKLGSFDAIFCGRQAIDGDTAQVGPQTAEKLQLNQITCVSKIEAIDLANKTITARRSIEGGFEKVRTKWPVLLTFTDEGYQPRPASAKRVMAFKNAATATNDQPYDETYLQTETMMNRSNTISLWDVNAIKADPDSCGLAGSPTWVKKIESVVLKSGEIKMIENNEVAIAGMIRELIDDHSME